MSQSCPQLSFDEFDAQTSQNSHRSKCTSMKKLLLVLALMALTVADVWRADLGKNRTKSIKTGDAEEEVENVLGRPTDILMPVSAGQTNFMAWL